MTPHYTEQSHRLVIMDLEPQITELQSVLGDYCDDWSLISELNILLLTVNVLGTASAVNEAIEAMQLDTESYLKHEDFVASEDFPYKRERIKHAISFFVRDVYQKFTEANMYGPDDRLAYAFAGWQNKHMFHAMFAPYPYLHEYPESRTGIVQGEPHSNRATDMFPTIYDPDLATRVYNACLRGEDIVPF